MRVFWKDEGAKGPACLIANDSFDIKQGLFDGKWVSRSKAELHAKQFNMEFVEF